MNKLSLHLGSKSIPIEFSEGTQVVLGIMTCEVLSFYNKPHTKYHQQKDKSRSDPKINDYTKSC